ncbi:hypothetical protein SLE2022_343150 [Rubroshorea leprosula]
MDEKEEFLNEFGEDYGYPNGPKSIDEIRATEFKRLDENGTVYLDHAGATLYSELQMEAIFKDLTGYVYGNPHSQSESSSATSDIIREARQQVLDYCNASPKDYKCIFTSGATAALKLVGENFPWSCQSSYMYTMENHNSVLGIREYALDKGAAAFAVDVIEGFLDEVSSSPVAMTSLKVSQHPVQRRSEVRFLERELTGGVHNLFAFPSECNFSGLRFNLDLVKIVKENAERILEGSALSKGHWMVLIDAAKGSATQPPDLSLYPADFVVLSFYKLFGYPTGLGALVVRNDAAKLLKKAYFSGGTVAASIADIDFVKRRKGVELFEDGTSSFLSIASIRHGFKILNSLTASAIFRHTASLAIYVKKKLLLLRHANGASVCTVYGSQTLKVSSHESGPIVSFNLKRPDGSWFGYREVEKLASLSGIQLRTGCFCNPGACAKYLGLSHSDLLSNIEAGHICWDDNDILHGKPTGAVRVSFGYMSTYEDAKNFMDFVRRSFVSIPSGHGNGYPLAARSIPFHCEGIERHVASSGYYLKSIIIYPIKSCGGFSVESWPLSSTGFKHDREWLLKSLTGEILTQKKVLEMSLISTFIDLNKEIMFVKSPHCKTKLLIKLNSNSNQYRSNGTEEIYLHGQRYDAQCYGNDINQWFSDAVGRPCILLRSCHSQNCFSLRRNHMGCCRDVDSTLSFANEAQFLLVSEESVSDLNNRISSNTQKRTHGEQTQVSAMRFRPNLIISGGKPYAEDGWRKLKIGNFDFTSIGGCNRCQMINISHQAEKVWKANEPLATLASYRRVKGKILFGILLRYDLEKKVELDQYSLLKVGEEVHPDLV